MATSQVGPIFYVGTPVMSCQHGIVGPKNRVGAPWLLASFFPPKLEINHKLKRSIYGLKQASRQQHAEFSEVLTTQNTNIYTPFAATYVSFIIYIDDLLTKRR